MRVGMLWFDDQKNRELADKIERAASHYQAKYGRRPTLCFVHPSMLLSLRNGVFGIEVRGSNTILPNHLWIGCTEEQPERSAA